MIPPVLALAITIPLRSLLSLHFPRIQGGYLHVIVEKHFSLVTEISLARRPVYRPLELAPHIAIFVPFLYTFAPPSLLGSSGVPSLRFYAMYLGPPSVCSPLQKIFVPTMRVSLEIDHFFCIRRMKRSTASNQLEVAELRKKRKDQAPLRRHLLSSPSFLWFLEEAFHAKRS